MLSSPHLFSQETLNSLVLDKPHRVVSHHQNSPECSANTSVTLSCSVGTVAGGILSGITKKSLVVIAVMS